MTYTYILPIGDWSEDGHNQSKDFQAKVNFPKDKLIEAYLATVDKVGITFDQVLGKEQHITILKRYEDDSIDIELIFKMMKHGVSVDKVIQDLPDNFQKIAENEDYSACYSSYGFSPKMAAELFLEFCKASLPELEYEIIKPEYLFGYWGKLNISVGYGVFN